MKVNKIKLILLILLLGTLFMIFGFSNQNGEESGAISQKITKVITKNIKVVQNLEEEQKKEILNKIEYGIRKIAHFSIYTIVGILLMVLMNNKLKKNHRIYISLIIGFLYAILDEMHQAFIPGRTPRITDIIIDTFGVLIGVLCVLIVVKLFQNKEKIDRTNKVT